MSLTRRVCEIAALCVALAILGTLIWIGVQARGLVLPDGQPLFGDFIAFWGAGRAALEGQAAIVHDPAALNAIQKGIMPTLGVHAQWNSPPTFLLIATGLALMPYPIAALVFLAGSGALYIAAARRLLPDARALLFAFTLPAAVYHVGSLQTGLLIAGVSGLALYWLDTRPRAAGALIALIAIKPHLALLWPIYLAVTGRWRAFAAAAMATTAFVVLAGCVFGFDAYARFIANIPATQDLVTGQRVSSPAYASLYGNLIGLHTPQTLAAAAQTLSAIAALAAAILVFRRGDARTQGAAFCAANLLILPYAFFYDFTLLAVGAAMLGAPRGRFETIALIAAWSAGLSLPLGYAAQLPLCTLAAWLTLTAALRRASAHPMRRSRGRPRSAQSLRRGAR